MALDSLRRKGGDANGATGNTSARVPQCDPVSHFETALAAGLKGVAKEEADNDETLEERGQLILQVTGVARESKERLERTLWLRRLFFGSLMSILSILALSETI
jgi:hypothetical protein